MLNKFRVFIYIIIIFVVIACSCSSNSNVSSYIYPVNSRNISSEFGYRFLFNRHNFHDGTDFAVGVNTKVYATCNGTVVFTGFTKTGYGNAVILSHYDGNKSLYGHLSDDFTVNIGDNIKGGDLIGYVGPKYLPNGRLNGNTTGPHLHFSIYDNSGKAINPISILN